MYINGIEGKSGKYELRKAKEKMVGKTNFRKESEENAPSSKLIISNIFYMSEGHTDIRTDKVIFRNVTSRLVIVGGPPA